MILYLVVVGCFFFKNRIFKNMYPKKNYRSSGIIFERGDGRLEETIKAMTL